jgi:putative metalloprotease
MIKKIQLSVVTSTLLLFTACSTNSLSIGAGLDLIKAATISNDEMKSMAFNAAQEYDAENIVAPDDNNYAIRLAKLTNNISTPDNLDLNIKVYLSDTVNAFAMADGTVRIYSGLMDLMTDDEVLFVIGHEIGHVKHEHSKQAYRMAYAASAVRKGVASGSGAASDLAASAIGGLVEELVNAQFSQSEETQADTYGLDFLRHNNIDTKASITALAKLQELGESSSMFASHPSSKERVDDIKKQL